GELRVVEAAPERVEAALAFGEDEVGERERLLPAYGVEEGDVRGVQKRPLRHVFERLLHPAGDGLARGLTGEAASVAVAGQPAAAHVVVRGAFAFVGHGYMILVFPGWSLRSGRTDRNGPGRTVSACSRSRSRIRSTHPA